MEIQHNFDNDKHYCDKCEEYFDDKMDHQNFIDTVNFDEEIGD